MSAPTTPLTCCRRLPADRALRPFVRYRLRWQWLVESGLHTLPEALLVLWCVMFGYVFQESRGAVPMASASSDARLWTAPVWEICLIWSRTV